MTQLLLLITVALLPLALAACSSPPPASQHPAEKPFFEDHLQTLDNWTAEGSFIPDLQNAGLRLKTTETPNHAGEFLWCKQILPDDYRIEFSMTPASDSGFFLIFFSVAGVHGEDILGDDLFNHYMPHGSWTAYQDWDKYTSPPNRKHQSRIQGYHISYRRNALANCNLRKNPGLNLLKSSDVKSILPKDLPAKVILTKIGGHITLTVNGETFMDYTDPTNPLHAGRFGFRQVYESEGVYHDVKVFDLTHSASAAAPPSTGKSATSP